MSGRIRPHLALATAPHEAARRHGRVPLHLDRPLDLFPDAGTELDYTSFAELVDRAAGLLTGAGITAGQRVMLVQQPNFNTPLLVFACARIGAVPVPVHAAVGAEPFGVMAERAEAAALITDAATEAAGVLDNVPLSTPRWYVGESGEHGRSLLDVTAGELPPLLAPAKDTPQLVTHSSGTTGVPKLVLHTVDSFSGHAKPQVFIGKLLRVNYPYLLCLSPVHARTMSGLLAVFSLGLELGFLTDPEPDNAVAMLKKLRPGLVETVPNAFIRWEEIAEQQPELFADVRMFVSSFDAAHPRTINTLLKAAHPKARYMQAYGQTETGPITVKVHRLKMKCEDGRCVGRPVIGHTKVRITDENGHGQVPRETAGPIFARSSGVTPSYLGTPDQRVEGWWAMGDWGVISKRGCLHLYDRIVDRSGDVDSLLATEDEILESLPQLTEAVLISVEGSLPVPLVCTRRDAPLDMDAWRKAVADMPALADPVQCRWDDIPHTATWKVKRLEVARRLAAGELVQLTER
ncbi:acyl--CoA ligase [Streptomyces sp. NA04227]|uniref:class I adenylate-forming enzyme family protein n=1 Tax=Streptomyces sp. NA04227 TaxID=2742136 RepID=UPI0015917DFD|nr:class I adenylate-forming enzyme family protein [Streptomyces sp. NA04227]QKW06902.1 acyl--CoA ligase [Streptomyces sp. NA04227]